MKIISLRIKNNFLGWDFDEVDLSSNLTLLVGVSGAGKTQILRAITDLSRIASGKAINGLEWEIKFSTVQGNEFVWEGSFNALEVDKLTFDDKNEKEKPSLIYEKLTLRNDVLIERHQETMKFKDQQMPKLSSHQSMIYILKEESDIKDAYDALNRIKYRDQTRNGIYQMPDKPLHLLSSKYQTVDSIVNSGEDIITKLYITYFHKLDVFNKIRLSFIDIFQQIEDIKVELLDRDDLPKNVFIPFVFIKEKSV
ncbi:MAG: hypothetical protein ACKPJF_26105, partial [Dolichospermum sp.]